MLVLARIMEKCLCVHIMVVTAERQWSSSGKMKGKRRSIGSKLTAIKFTDSLGTTVRFDSQSLSI